MKFTLEGGFRPMGAVMVDGEGEFLNLGDVRFDRATQNLLDADGRPISLRHQSLAVLSVLAADTGEPVTKDKLIAEAWGSVNVTDDSLVQCIADIRRAIGDEAHTIVRTIPKVGYKLVAESPNRTGRKANMLRYIGLAAAVLPVLALLASLLFGAFGGGQGTARPRIAVLPFANLSDDPNQAYFTDGFTKAITAKISKFEGLYVVSSFSAFKFRSSDKSVDQIAQDLGVRYVLSGDVQPGADRIAVNAQLTDAQDGTAIWEERYTAPRTDVFDLQDELGSKIASTLVERLENSTAQRARVSRTEDLNAYELTLRAEEHRVDKKSLNEAISLLDQAIALDPEFTFAHAERAKNQLLLWRHSLADDLDEALAQARASAARAIDLDHNSYEAYHILSQIDLYADRDHAQAFANLKRALEINPNDADVMVRMATLLGFMDRDAEANAWIARAMRQNPLHPAWYPWNAAFVYAVSGKNEEAIVASKKALAVYKTSASIRRILIAAHGNLGQWDQAERYAAEILEQFPDFRLSTHMRNSPFMKSEEWEGILATLRKAGLPD